MSRAATIHILVVAAATIFVLALLTGWYMKKPSRRPMFTRHSAESGRGFRGAWPPPYPLTDEQEPATRGYCDVEHNIVVLVSARVGVEADPTKAAFRMEGMTAVVTREDTNKLFLLWYDKKQAVERVTKIRIPAGLAGRVEEAYESMPRGQTIIDLITSQMSEPDAKICRAEYAAIQR